jgi:hypothetical protein
MGGFKKDYEKMSIALDFLSKFRGGVAVTNRYRVELFLPAGVSSAGGAGVNDDARAGAISSMQNYFNSSEQINAKCRDAILPGRSLDTYDYRQNSAPFRLPYSSTYGPASLTFLADSGFDSRDFFEVWQSAVVNIGTNTLNFPNEYVADVNIYILDRAGDDRYGVKLYEAWPVDISETQLSYADQDTAAAVTVSLEYKYWSPHFNSQEKNGSAT